MTDSLPAYLQPFSSGADVWVAIETKTVAAAESLELRRVVPMSLAQLEVEQAKLDLRIRGVVELPTQRTEPAFDSDLERARTALARWEAVHPDFVAEQARPQGAWFPRHYWREYDRLTENIRVTTELDGKHDVISETQNSAGLRVELLARRAGIRNEQHMIRLSAAASDELLRSDLARLDFSQPVTLGTASELLIAGEKQGFLGTLELHRFLEDAIWRKGTGKLPSDRETRLQSSQVLASLQIEPDVATASLAPVNQIRRDPVRIRRPAPDIVSIENPPSSLPISPSNNEIHMKVAEVRDLRHRIRYELYELAASVAPVLEAVPPIQGVTYKWHSRNGSLVGEAPNGMRHRIMPPGHRDFHSRAADSVWLALATDGPLLKYRAGQQLREDERTLLTTQALMELNEAQIPGQKELQIAFELPMDLGASGGIDNGPTEGLQL